LSPVPVFDETHERLFKEPNLAAVTTLRKDGTPHTSPVWVDWDGEHVLVNTAYGRAKVRHVQSNPQVAVMVVDRNEPYTWVAVSGPAALVEEGAEEHIHELSRRYVGEDYTIAEDERRVIMRITPERVTER
jgi:PPOX class probable F420-dependent enzyme